MDCRRIENCTFNTLYKQISENVLSDGYPWFYGFIEEDDNRTFGHVCFQNNESFSSITDMSLVAISSIIETKLNMEVEDISKLTYEMMLPNEESFRTKPNCVYTDYPGTVVYWFLNDTDSKLTIYNEEYDHFNKKPKPSEFTVKEEIEIKANTAVVFNNKYYHSINSSSSRVVYCSAMVLVK